MQSRLIAPFLAAMIFGNSGHAADYKPLRTPDGKPDLQGVWTNVSLTTLFRSPQFKTNSISVAEAERLERQRAASMAASLRPTDPNAPAPPAGGNVGGYNSFYGDSGDRLAFIKGEYRTTWVVDPPIGKPPYSEKGQQAFTKALAFARETFDGPEARPIPERCIVGFGSTGGPPMINVLYNNTYQIVQTPDAVMILVEMNHDARVIRMNGKRLPENIRPWLGDSIGRWEGDTLVVETSNFNPGESLRSNFNQTLFMSQNAKVTERFTRISDREIFYEFSVDDPEVFSQVWRGEMVFNATPGPVYEYACHEGNYALPGILAGAREAEREAANKK